jgi:hypothetical protein
LFREFVIAKQVAERLQRAELSYVWLNAALQRQKRMPSLEEFVTPRQATQTRDEQRRQLQNISARFGIPLRKTKLIRVH